MKAEKIGQLIYYWDNETIIATIRVEERNVFNKKILRTKLDEPNETNLKIISQPKLSRKYILFIVKWK